MTTVLDPTDETAIPQRERVARPESLNGLTVGLLDISKPRGNLMSSRSSSAATTDPAVSATMASNRLDFAFTALLRVRSRAPTRGTVPARTQLV